MAIQRSGRIRVVAEARTPQLLPSGVLGMLIFVFAELMLFGGLISAFTIIKSGAAVWPPPDQPRKSFEDTVCTPGRVITSDSGLRPRVGVSAICRCPIDMARSELLVATWTAEASTSTVVATSPTDILMSCKSTRS